jgi:hypothetical protein
MQIPGRDIIIQGLVRSGEKLVLTDAGQFSADSSGFFTYTLRKVRYACYNNFCPG